MTDRTFRSALEEMLGSIERAIEKVGAGEGPEPELHSVRTCLLDVLELVERDPGIVAASDDLDNVAREVAAGTDRGPRMARLLREAFLRFRDRLGSARPNDKARGMGLS